MADQPANSSLHTAGPASYYLPTADVVRDKDGNPVEGPDALEVQRKNFAAAEKAAAEVQSEESEPQEKVVPEPTPKKVVAPLAPSPLPKVKAKPAVEEKK